MLACSKIHFTISNVTWPIESSVWVRYSNASPIQLNININIRKKNLKRKIGNSASKRGSLYASLVDDSPSS